MRDDLNPAILQTATSLGWTYDEPELVGKGRTFSRDNTHIWECIHKPPEKSRRPMWVRANLVNSRYQDHLYYEELLDALKGENGVE